MIFCFGLGNVSKKSLASAKDQILIKSAQLFLKDAAYRSDMMRCANFLLWGIGAFVLLKLKCRGPPCILKRNIYTTK